MSISNLTSPTAVRLAVSECVRLGRESFLRLYGYGFAREYPLIYDGNEFDSKAIAGVAHGYQFPDQGPLRATEFSGGIAPGGAALKLFQLGFSIPGLQRRPDDWTLKECEIAADAYFECLRHKLSNQAFNRNQALTGVATRIGRSRGSVDYKFQNIDSILMGADLPRLNDAVAANAQQLLRFVVLDPLSSRFDFLNDSVTPHDEIVATDGESISRIFVPAPHILPREGTSESLVTCARKIDFAARDANNRRLGVGGEEWVLSIERRRLTDLGRADLANKVQWVSRLRGDGLGFDIESFDDTGDPIFIEVKTTTQGITAPFYLTHTEIQVSEQLGGKFRLFRVFNFADNPQIYVLSGPLRDKVTLEPRVYLGQPI
jgi:hypothetical protein